MTLGYRAVTVLLAGLAAVYSMASLPD